eukprot:PITA_06742
MLAFHASGDRPAGVTNRQCVLGFVLTLCASVLYGFIIPLIELAYRKTKRQITYTLVMEMQLFFIGVFGVTSMASSLLSAVLVAFTLPVTEVLAVVFFREKFSAEKGMALVLALWGFASYIYGEYYCDSKMRPPNVPKQQNEAEDPGGAGQAYQSVNDVSEDQSINGVEELAMDDSGKAL